MTNIADWHTALPQAVEALKMGGIVAYPTEAVFGIGCDPSNITAINHLAALKGRPSGKGFILIAADLQQLHAWIQPVDEERTEAILTTWPGPFSWVFKAAAHVPDILCGPERTLAVRVTAHPVANALCLAFGKALISTSANPHQAPPAKSAEEVERYFGAHVDIILQGKLGGFAQPTEIRHAMTGEILRHSEPKTAEAL